MPKGDSVLTHPDKDEITQRLLNGESVKDVDQWLKMKYKAHKSRQISWMTLQAYRKDRLNLQGEVLTEVKAERKELIKQAKEEKKQLIVKESYAYIEAKRKLADNLLDVEQNIVFIHDKIKSRIILLEAEEVKHLNDRVICEYLAQLRTLLIDYMKMKEDQDKKASSNTNININMGQVSQQISILKQCIREALIEAGVEHVVPIFLEKLGTKLQNAGQNVGETMAATAPVVNIQVNNNNG